jgi:hypothetical protein
MLENLETFVLAVSLLTSGDRTGRIYNPVTGNGAWMQLDSYLWSEHRVKVCHYNKFTGEERMERR